jgi:hypothetical protein
MPPKYIKCPHCGTLFGIEGDDAILRIKFKDLYREIEGRAAGPCRKCGSYMVWPEGSFILEVKTTEEQRDGRA